MLLSRPSGYALEALLQLARSGGDSPVPSGQLAATGNMPGRYLLAILRKLVEGGILHSRRGAEGGYLLARRPSEISLLSIIEAVDGAITDIWVRPDERGQRKAVARRNASQDDTRFATSLMAFSEGLAGSDWDTGEFTAVSTAGRDAADSEPSARSAFPGEGKPDTGKSFAGLSRAVREFLASISVADLLGPTPRGPTPLAPGILQVGSSPGDLSACDWVI